MEAQRLRNDFGAEVAFANEEGNDENPGGGEIGQDGFDVGLLFPEGFADGAEKLASAQFGRVLVDRGGGLVVQRRAMSQQDQGVGLEVFAVHPASVPEAPGAAKAKTAGYFPATPLR